MHPSTSLAALTGALALVFSVGCSSQNDELTKQLDTLQKEVNRLRSSNLTLQDRVDALEEGQPLSPRETVDDEGGDVDDRPILEVVRLSPEQSVAEAPVVVMTPEQAPDEPRPSIVGDARSVERVDEADAKKTPKKPRWRKR